MTTSTTAQELYLGLIAKIPEMLSCPSPTMFANLKNAQKWMESASQAYLDVEHAERGLRLAIEDAEREYNRAIAPTPQGRTF